MTLTVVCAWCGKSMGTKEGFGVEGISHGICKECKAKMEEEIEALPPKDNPGRGGNVARQERIDPVERRVLELTAKTPELRRLAATIIEEGVDPKDLLAAPGRRVLTLIAAMAIRALRPPFRLTNSMAFGEAALWDIER